MRFSLSTRTGFWNFTSLHSMQERIRFFGVLIITFIVLVRIGCPFGAKADESTFIFLADPQIDRDSGRDVQNSRFVDLQMMNWVLNNIESETWPDNDSVTFRDQNHDKQPGNLTCENEAVGEVSSIFFGGDLTQCGGDSFYYEQRILSELVLGDPLLVAAYSGKGFPAGYKGGWELQALRLLYDKNFTDLKYYCGTTFYHYPGTDFVKTKYQKVYFGLGNHDISSENANWFKWRFGTGLGDLIKEEKDYWRWQMWNFISQMYAGPYHRPEGNVSPVFPVDSIDAPPAYDEYGKDAFDWTKYSFNYRVNLGPVEVFQLHFYGGYDGSLGNSSSSRSDDEKVDRASGIPWLISELDKVGPHKPIIIIQHLKFNSTWWEEWEKDNLKEILEPYHVICFLTGHQHGTSAFAHYEPIKESSKIIKDFNIGSASAIDVSPGRQFALVKVTDTDFNIAVGTVEDDLAVDGWVINPPTFHWSFGYGEEFFIANAGGPYVGDEGTAITFDGGRSKGDINAYYWDLDDDGLFEATGPEVSKTWNDDYGGTITLEVVDYAGNSITDSTTVTVNNVAPTVMDVEVIPPVAGFILPGQELEFASGFTDPGAYDLHSADWDFGDGKTDSGTLTEENEPPDASGTVSVTHTYADPGTFTIVLTVEDDDGGAGTAQGKVVVLTASEAVDYIDHFIQNLPESAFRKNSVQRGNAFSEKCVEIQEKIAAGDLQCVIKKLQNDIRAKADGHVDGNPGNDWIIDVDFQSELCLMIDALVNYLGYQ